MNGSAYYISKSGVVFHCLSGVFVVVVVVYEQQLDYKKYKTKAEVIGVAAMIDWKYACNKLQYTDYEITIFYIEID